MQLRLRLCGDPETRPSRGTHDRRHVCRQINISQLKSSARTTPIYPAAFYSLRVADACGGGGPNLDARQKSQAA